MTRTTGHPIAVSPSAVNPAMLRWGIFALALLSASCSLVVKQRRECESTTECREAFGLGSTCEPTGLCGEPVTDPRCTATFPTDLYANFDAYRDHILLGSIYSYRDHRDTMLSTELAIRQANLAGGVDGREFAIVHCDYTPMQGDSLSDLEATERITRHLAVDLGVPAIIGPRGSGRTIRAFNQLRDRQVVLISPSATSPELTVLENPPNDAMPGFLWRAVPPDTLQAEAIARDLEMRGVTSIAILYQMGSYGEALSALLETRFLEGSGDVTRTPFASRDAFGDQVATIGAGTADEVVFISSDLADSIAFINATGATPDLADAYASKSLFLTDAAYNEQIVTSPTGLARNILSRIRGTRPASAAGTPLYNAFAADLNVTYSLSAGASGFTSHAYDAGWLVIYGAAWSIQSTGEVSGLGIAQGLRRLSGGQEIDIRPSSLSSVVGAFRQGQSVDVNGASGALNYDPATEETSSPIEVWRVEPAQTPPLQTVYLVDP